MCPGHFRMSNNESLFTAHLLHYVTGVRVPIHLSMSVHNGCDLLMSQNVPWLVIHVFSQRMSWLRILGSVLFVSMSWSRVTQLPDCPVSVSTTKGNTHECARTHHLKKSHLLSIKFIFSPSVSLPFPHFYLCHSPRCIDEWFEVNRSCPEHPSD